MNLKNTHILVIGAGTMGSGIAQTIACSNSSVCILDTSVEAINRSRSSIHKKVEKMYKKNLLSMTDYNSIVSNRITWVNSMNDVSKLYNISKVIEAATENETVKINLIELVNKTFDNRDIFYATNTSSISITRMASYFKTPEKFIGLHFMNPVPYMKLVEIIPGLQTSKNTIDIFKDFAKNLGKTPIQSLDQPGFITNRILMPMINEAFYALMENIGSAENIDLSMKLGCGFPMGPLTLADFIGLDTCLYIMQVLHKDIGEDKYRACPLLKKYVDAGWVGQKSGRGVYTYK
jgi:3-hydroxybutyryl-CoA dehydrogenase